MKERFTNDDERFYTFDSGNLEIPYKICINKRLKYLRLVVCTKGVIILTPYAISQSEAENILKNKEKWVRQKYLNYRSIQMFNFERNWVDGEKILYRGLIYEIKINTAYNKEVKIEFDGQKFDIYLNCDFYKGKQRFVAIENAFKIFFIQNANDVLLKKVNYYSQIMGLSYNSIRVKDVKTFWGSCSKKGNLNFNWRIIMAPNWIIDYIVIHELCHLKYMNHSKEFWDMVEIYMPSFYEARIWLKENGFQLDF